jgi:hypothetical protein
MSFGIRCSDFVNDNKNHAILYNKLSDEQYIVSAILFEKEMT